MALCRDHHRNTKQVVNVLITLTDDHLISLLRNVGGVRRVSLFAISAVFALGTAACVPGGSSEFSKPVAATSEPVVLNGAEGAAAGSAEASAAPAKATPPADGAAPADRTPAVAVAPADEPKAADGGAKDAAAAFAATPEPAATAAVGAVEVPAKNAAGYPNINIPPKEPQGALLPPDERARVISELQALAKRQAGAAPADTPPPKAKGKAKKLTGKCTDDQLAAADPNCEKPTN
jgi:hypothetical protein